MCSNIYQMINIMWQLYKYKNFMSSLLCPFCLQKSNKPEIQFKKFSFFSFYRILGGLLFIYICPTTFSFISPSNITNSFNYSSFLFFILYPPHHNHPHFTLLYCLLYFCLLNWYYILVYLKFQNGPMHSQRQKNHTVLCILNDKKNKKTICISMSLFQYNKLRKII